MFFFCVVCVCHVIMKITVIVILNKNALFTNGKFVKAVVQFRAFNIPSVALTTENIYVELR